MITPLWDPLPSESAKAYQAFCIYRDLGPRRSIDEASRIYHQRPVTSGEQPARRPRASGTIRYWANQWQWRARVIAWDEEMARIHDAERITRVREMIDRHIKEAVLVQQKALASLRQLRPGDLNPREASNLLREATKLERLALDQAARDPNRPDRASQCFFPPGTRRP